MLQRSQALLNLLDPRRDIDKECGYPEYITTADYRKMYDREGVAERVVRLMPEESWPLNPAIYETEDADETEFERAWAALEEELGCLSYLAKIDELSGIGAYGLLLLGFDDAAGLDTIAPGINERGESSGTPGNVKLLYLRALDESLCEITKYEKDPTNPRFGYPTEYSITLNDSTLTSTDTTTPDQSSIKVHWSRVIHVADNRKSSEVFGVPRMKPVFNRLQDIRKILAGSAEMFWQGAFPGLVFEAHKENDDVELDAESVRDEMWNMMNGLQRTGAVQGGTMKSLAPQVASPGDHLEAQYKAIALTLGVPWRIFLGTEEARLASGQDATAWLRRIDRRRRGYVTPCIIRPFITRLMMVGVLPMIEPLMIDWPDLQSPSDADKAAVAVTRTDALAKYVGGGVDTLIPPHKYLTMILGMESEEVDAIIEEAIEHIEAANPDADPSEIVPGRNPTPPALDQSAGESDDETGKQIGKGGPPGKPGAGKSVRGNEPTGGR